MTESVVLVRHTTSLVGILTEPAAETLNPSAPTVLILNAGIVHRVGPNRLHVAISRDLAAAGFPVFRFDFSGIGDSDPRPDDTPFRVSSVEEVRWAMDHLDARTQAGRYVLLGLCSGANVAFQAACKDPRVAAIVGINGTYLDEADRQNLQGQLERSIHGRYYRKHAWDTARWRRLLTGKSDIKKIVRFLVGACRQRRSPPGHARSPVGPADRWETLVRRGVDSLLVYSEGSTALDAFSLGVQPYLRTQKRARMAVEVIEDCDHVFTLLWTQRSLMERIRTWMLSPDRDWGATSSAARAACKS